MFATRGYRLEVTSERVPTLRTLRAIVDLLACCQYTEFHLDETPLALEDRVALAAYCEMQGLRLVTDWGPQAARPICDRGTFPTDEHAFAGLSPQTTILVSGSEANYPFAEGVARVRAAGFEAYVGPATSAACSLGGRVENMRENLEAAEAAGRLHGAAGYLLIDPTDSCGWHPLAASLPALILGGAFASSGAKAARMDLEHELDRVMDAPLGGTLLRLGTLYLRGGAIRFGGSELFAILSHPIGFSRHPALTDPILEEIGAVARGCRMVAERWTERNDWAKEIVWMADLIDAACHRRDESRLRALRDEHGRVWRLRFREEGRISSLAKIPRF